MDKNKYNQMGFDFGDTDPDQESPAAGFRLKQLKPASKADAGETEQENDNQENFTAQSGGNGQDNPAMKATTVANQAQEQPGMGFEPVSTNQKSENDPHNDSEVIRNTPVTSEEQ